MENQHGGVTTSDQATRIYMFGDQFPLAAAKEQAEKKLAASRLLAKLNPLYPPKESTIMFSLREERHEPFWHIAPPASPQV